jgi:hypothetical protein
MAVAVLHEFAFGEREVRDIDGAKLSPVDRRREVRLNAEDASWLRRARLKYGSTVRVIDISTRGSLIEYEGTPFTPPSNVIFEFSSATGAVLVSARVLRNRSMDGNGRFQTACVFKRPLSVECAATHMTFTHRRRICA